MIVHFLVDAHVYAYTLRARRNCMRRPPYIYPSYDIYSAAQVTAPHILLHSRSVLQSSPCRSTSEIRFLTSTWIQPWGRSPFTSSLETGQPEICRAFLVIPFFFHQYHTFATSGTSLFYCWSSFPPLLQLGGPVLSPCGLHSSVHH